MSFSKTSNCSILVKVQNQNVLVESNYENVNPYLKHREGTFTELPKKAILIKEQKIEISRFFYFADSGIRGRPNSSVSARSSDGLAVGAFGVSMSR